MVKAIEFCIELKVNIINMSLGTCIADQRKRDLLEFACEKAIDAGIVIFAADTNVQGKKSYPANFEQVIRVSSDQGDPAYCNITYMGKSICFSENMNRFEFDGEKYKKASKHQKEWGNSLISELSLGGNEEILDLGCGDGSLTVQLAQLVPNGRVLGIDASMGMITTAQKHVATNIAFMQMDINTIDFQGAFDVIFSSHLHSWSMHFDK